MANSTTTQEKKKQFRFFPLIAGIFIILQCFFAEIPLSILSPIFGTTINNIPLEILSYDSVRLFLWGSLENSTSVFSFNEFSLDSLFVLLFWSMIFISGIFGIIGSRYNEDPKKLKKLVKIGTLFIFIEILYDVFIYVYFIYFSSISVQFGIGFYLLLIDFVFYIISFVRMTDYVIEK